MNQTYYTIITKQGAALLANATALGVPLKITQMAVGDGNGKIPKPDESQTKLVHEVRRAAINTLFVDKENPNQIIAEQVIPESDGGWFIHEIGLFDDKGNLIAVGNCPATYKPKLVEGSGRTQVIRMVIIVDNAQSIELKIDPAVVLATREYVDDLITATMTAHEKSTNHPNATTKSKGFVQLNSAIDSNLENQAATPLAVKKTYDLANGAVKRSGDNMTGPLNIKGQPVLTKRSYGIGVSHVLGDESIDETKNQYSGFLFSQEQSQGTTPFDFCHVIRSYVLDSFSDIAIDTKSKRVKFRSVITDKQNPYFTGDYNWSEFITSNNISNYIPVGIPQPWPKMTPPSGWFECNGSTFDKNKFPKLAVAYPAGKLPDLRGEFIRGWDNGKGTDSNRGVLSWQNDAIRNIYGEISPISETFGAAHVATGAFQYFEKHSDHTPTSIDRGLAGGVTFDASRIVPTANENRPRNVAFMYIVKAE